MSKAPSRTPRTFKLDPPNDPPPDTPRVKTRKQPSRARKPKAVVPPADMQMQPDDAAQRLEENELLKDLTPPQPIPGYRPWPGLKTLLLFTFGGLVSLALGLWIDGLIRELFSRQDWLGWLGVVLVVVFAATLLLLGLRELVALRRLARIDAIRKDAQAARHDNDTKLARRVVDRLLGLYSGRPDTAQARTDLTEHRRHIIDGADLIALCERDLLMPLDARARALVMGSAKRVSVVTAVSPRAIIDIAFVLFENLRLIRQLAQLYGGHPGTFGFWRLARTVIGHLAVTGSIAVGEGLLQQVVGQSVASKISTRLGEGVVNGLLTARIGIAAIDVCRPMPFGEAARPGISDFLSELTRLSPSRKTTPD